MRSKHSAINEPTVERLEDTGQFCLLQQPHADVPCIIDNGTLLSPRQIWPWARSQRGVGEKTIFLPSLLTQMEWLPSVIRLPCRPRGGFCEASTLPLVRLQVCRKLVTTFHNANQFIDRNAQN